MLVVVIYLLTQVHTKVGLLYKINTYFNRGEKVEYKYLIC